MRADYRIVVRLGRYWIARPDEEIADWNGWFVGCDGDRCYRVVIDRRKPI